MVVTDATRDERFSDNPLVTAAPHIRFYAGAPMLTAQGIPLGTICVIDHAARELAAGPRRALLALGRQASALLELRRVNRSLAVALDNVRTLEGLLPMCAQCKAVREDDGTWLRVDAYVIKHTSVNVSHGICPDCAARLYPGLDLSGKEPRPTATRVKP